MRLKDQVVMITGGAAGIGEEYAYGLAREGAKVCLFDVAPESTVQSVVQDIREEGGEAMGLSMDIRDHDGVLALAKKVYETWGRIDGLVNNAVWQPAKPFAEFTVEEFDQMTAINIRGAWSSIVAVYPYM